jgi:hypothetical protein
VFPMGNNWTIAMGQGLAKAARLVPLERHRPGAISRQKNQFTLGFIPARHSSRHSGIWLT